MSRSAHTALPREHALGALLETAGLDAVLCSSYEALCYFAGTDIRTQLHLAERLEFLLVPRGQNPLLLVCNIEQTQVEAQSPIADVRTYVEFEDDPATKLATVLSELGLTRGRIGIEGARLPAAALRTLERQLPGVDLVSLDRELERLQVVKTNEEVERLAELAQLLLAVLQRTIGIEGVTEQDYAGDLVSRISAEGALPLFLVFSAGERTMLGHPEPERTPMREGTIWRADYGARLAGGLCGDVARTGVVGEASPEQAEIFAAVRAAQEAVVTLAEPGRPASELFRACARSFAAAGLPFVMPHVGHGIGIGIHEAPLLEPRNDTRLESGTVLNIEPFALVRERGEGYHTEDLVLVSDEGPQRLTEPQEQLLSIVPPKTGAA